MISTPKQKCSNRTYGQVRNYKLHIPLFSTTSQCKRQNGETVCTGRTRIQSSRRRQYSFSIGFDCDSDDGSFNRLRENITLYEESNFTQCDKIPDLSSAIVGTDCGKFYPFTSFPNLMGDQNLQEAMSSLNSFYVRYHGALTSNNTASCYKHFDELVCYLFFPRCENRDLLPPCRDMCQEYFKGCGAILSSDFFKMNCQYLPLKNEGIPCFYKPVTCKPPMVIDNAIIKNFTNGTHYFATSEIEYACSNGYSLHGDAIVTCQFNGQWSNEPLCERKQGSYEVYQFILPIIVLIVVETICVIFYRWWRKRKFSVKSLSRNMDYDAFVICRSKDIDYVADKVIPALEEHHDPPFKLIVWERNFLPGSPNHREYYGGHKHQQYCNNFYVTKITL